MNLQSDSNLQQNPPSEKDDNKTILIILAIVIVAVVVSTVLAVAWFSTPTEVDEPPCCEVPYASFSEPEIFGPTEVVVEFDNVTGEPKPMDLEIVLVMNLTSQGTYSFATNADADLFFVNGSGTDVGDINFSDLENNEKADAGDMLILSGLSPQSEYQIKMIWGPTGDMITSTIFSTP